MQAGEEPVTATWEEARPPHLPDRITAVPILVWPFVALAVLLAFLQFRRYGGMSGAGADVVALAPGVIEVAAMTLLGAALFVRHPDAWSRLRPVALGVTLLAVAEALRLLAPMVDDVAAATGITGEAGDVSPVFTVVLLRGCAQDDHRHPRASPACWIGFRATRTLGDPPGTRAILAALLVVGLGVFAVGYGREFALGAFDGDGVVVVANAIVIATVAAGLVAWIAVASELLAGARVQERPSRGLAQSGAVAALRIVHQRGAALLHPAASMDATSAAFSVAVWSVMLIATGSALLLLVAFLLGLPAPSEAKAEETAEADPA